MTSCRYFYFVLRAVKINTHVYYFANKKKRDIINLSPKLIKQNNIFSTDLLLLPYFVSMRFFDKISQLATCPSPFTLFSFQCFKALLNHNHWVSHYICLLSIKVNKRTDNIQIFKWKLKELIVKDPVVLSRCGSHHCSYKLVGIWIPSKNLSIVQV